MAHFEIFKNKKGEYRWRLRASNKRIIADSGESYKRKRDCLHGMRLVKRNVRKAKVVDMIKSRSKKKVSKGR